MDIRVFDRAAAQRARERWLFVAKPLFGLGRFEDMIIQIAGIKGSEMFGLDKKALVVMCADNGIVAEGVTQTGQEVTAAVAANFLCGKTSVCKMAELAGVDVFPVDIGIARDVDGLTVPEKKLMYGTDNMTKGPAMSRETAERAVKLGIETAAKLAKKGYEIICTGEMGIGNTSAASAVISAFLDMPPEMTVGRGAGLDSAGLKRKTDAVKKALDVNRPDKNDALDVLSKVGGLDIAGLAGVFIGGAVCGVPVVTDGFISAAAALCAVRLCGGAADFILPSHVSKEPAVGVLFRELGLTPVIDANMCLGEGSGAVMLMPLLDMACAVYAQMPTFDDIKIERYRIQE
ncbi:MAG: nicotinate-nucleotide--dimethylbenzimidazole phosphoribosyltransferase [Firmicutes bacterium]|nr:nicotinate-nucleotide--dimethylbenzimidazole phosphoribosyltransferase [Bacillota bacterium]